MWMNLIKIFPNPCAFMVRSAKFHPPRSFVSFQPSSPTNSGTVVKLLAAFYFRQSSTLTASCETMEGTFGPFHNNSIIPPEKKSFKWIEGRGAEEFSLNLVMLTPLFEAEKNSGAAVLFRCVWKRTREKASRERGGRWDSNTKRWGRTTLSVQGRAEIYCYGVLLKYFSLGTAFFPPAFSDHLIIT